MMLSVLGQRELGVHATGFARLHSFDYKPAPDIVPPRGRLGYLRAAARAIREHNVVHFYFGQSFLPRQLDAPWLARMGKRVAIEFLAATCGCRPSKQGATPITCTSRWRTTRGPLV